MLKRISNLMKVTLLLIVLLMAVACTTTTATPTTPTLTVDEAVAATMAAQNAVALQVQQTVDAALAEQGNNGLDLADPASGIEPVKSVPDPNTASGTPQLRVNSSSVNVRNGPGTNYPVISTLLKDSVVTAVAKNRDGSWFQITLPGGAQGWIANSVTDSVVEADMASVPVAAVIPPPPAVAATKTTAATAPTTAAAAPATSVATTSAPTPTATAETPTNTPEPITTGPTQLTKTSWQVDFLFLGGSHRLQATFTQSGGVLSGSNRDNNAEVDIITTGTVTADTVVITFTLSNGGSPRGSVTCTGTIDAGPPQIISGTFTAPTNEAVGGDSGNCTFR